METYAVLESIWTLVLLVVFVAIVIWAWSSKRKKAFDEAARMALDDEGDAPPGEKRS